jgi:hypothetical protein
MAYTLRRPQDPQRGLQTLAKAEKREDRNNDDDQPDEIDKSVHGCSLFPDAAKTLGISETFLENGQRGEGRLFAGVPYATQCAGRFVHASQSVGSRRISAIFGRY